MSEKRCPHCGKAAHGHGLSGCVNVLLDENRRLRAVVRSLAERCEKVAKITDDPNAYDLLNDARWKAEQEADR